MQMVSLSRYTEVTGTLSASGAEREPFNLTNSTFFKVFFVLILHRKSKTH